MKIEGYDAVTYIKGLREDFETKKKEVNKRVEATKTLQINVAPFINHIEKNLVIIERGVAKYGWIWFDEKGSMKRVNEVANGQAYMLKSHTMLGHYLNGTVTADEVRKKHEYNKFMFLYNK